MTILYLLALVPVAVVIAYPLWLFYESFGFRELLESVLAVAAVFLAVSLASWGLNNLL